MVVCSSTARGAPAPGTAEKAITVNIAEVASQPTTKGARKKRIIKITKAGSGMLSSAFGSSSAAPLAFRISLKTMIR